MLRNKWFQFALKFVLSATLLWFVFRKIDISTVIDRVSDMTYLASVLLLGLAFALIINNSVRWRIVLTSMGIHLSFGIAFRFILIGLFFSQTLPSSIGGDAVRAFLCYRHGIEPLSAINGVMLERIITMLGLILLVVAIQPFLFERIDNSEIELVFPMLALASITGIILLMCLDRSPARFRHWRLFDGLSKLAQHTRKLFLNPRYFFPALS